VGRYCPRHAIIEEYMIPLAVARRSVVTHNYCLCVIIKIKIGEIIICLLFNVQLIIIIVTVTVTKKLFSIYKVYNH
jgi:hypothetical protein